MRCSQYLLLLLLPLCAQGQQQQASRQLLWGDTHVHTSYSSDAFVNSNLSADPDTAYRYATGLPVIHPYHGARIQIETPLDFLVVSDHAEFLGMLRHVYYDGADTAELGLLASIKARIATWVLRRAIDNEDGRALFVDILPRPHSPTEAAAEGARGGVEVGWLPSMPQVEIDSWKDITSTAERYNRPGEFSAIIGWEWSSIPGGANLHRVVLSDTNATVAQQFQPFGLDDSPYPEDLWAWLERTQKATGATFIAIPHNSNISKGVMFDELTLRGEPLSAAYIAQRARWEPIAEITQIKGDSETHPQLSPADAFADFETYTHYIQREPTPYEPRVGDYLRPALLRGLELEQRLGQNPYRLGLIGSTDSHTGMSSAEERNFHGKLATDSIPANKSRSWGEDSGPTGWAMSASGMAAVWASENTREAIVAAMQRREVYATTGPRIGVQFFGGWDFTATDTAAAGLYQRATAAGVPMGGELRGDGRSRTPAMQAGPSFIVQATRDPGGANLDRIQIVKGWLASDGRAREQVFDVAWSGARQADANGQLPPVGNSVDIASGRVDNSIGAPHLLAVWQDPDFNPAQSTFYYARVLQIPTPRHSLLDALALGQQHAGSYPDTIQERAYTSPIWYRPDAKNPDNAL